ncbi:MAG: bifunctional DNA-formamidopyrimidine glycosylase/DNA-(apurinic or apyrimidinic site) lyase [Hahellaceae bacterium]|nr:bifunctional DNA-formamidopyrimidine glycosylase/DNA-(apurinic or apyrimidinic site) lyase [Hahellaceae bacterium]MCP5169301.1 bifunctional DNA-formamidopyrimidine glycosylase/DNA-(apurinic or apyrimidinic site) lyase [Hahellaceae bacterium]
MPELPEVETTRRGIAPHIQHHRLENIVIRQPQLRWPVSAELKQLSSQTICDVTRRGKYILIHTESGGTVIIHLGMSGSLRVLPTETKPAKHDHVDLIFDHGMCLRYNDPRRFGAILWTDDYSNHPLLASLGPEPLSDAFTHDHLFLLSRHKRVAVKQFIMDSHVVVGVGNIYANESLFMAGIHPNRPAGNISAKRYLRLTEAIKQVLGFAIQRGGTTLRDFVGGDGKPGYFQQELLVYGRGGENCKQCNHQLKEIRLGQRTTVYCPRCQR